MELLGIENRFKFGAFEQLSLTVLFLFWLNAKDTKADASMAESNVGNGTR